MLFGQIPNELVWIGAIYVLADMSENRICESVRGKQELGGRALDEVS